MFKKVKEKRAPVRGTPRETKVAPRGSGNTQSSLLSRQELLVDDEPVNTGFLLSVLYPKTCGTILCERRKKTGELEPCITVSICKQLFAPVCHQCFELLSV